MIANAPARVVRAGFLTLVLAIAAVSPAPAQQPSANAIALAKEIIVADMRVNAVFTYYLPGML